MTEYTNAEKARLEEAAFNKAVDALEASELPTANIMVAGITGAGKSTLLNAVFGADVATTGRGRPVTEQIDEYHTPDIPIHIWDTVGLEIDTQKTKDSIAAIRNVIAQKSDDTDPFNRIHAIWYCINSGSNRYQGAELDFINTLYSLGVPFIIVLTQCYGDEEEVNEFAARINEINAQRGLIDVPVVQVLAQDFKTRGFVVPSFGLEDLVNVTLEKSPSFVKSGFAAAQRVSKQQKRLECEEEIYKYVALARKGFWDKILFVNIISANKRVLKMFEAIGKIYNTALTPESIEKITSESGIDFSNAFFGLINPLDMNYSKKVTRLLQEKKEDGFNVEIESFEHNEKVARLLAFYGYTFVDSIEELWESFTEAQLKDLDIVVRNLIGIINDKLKDRKPRKN